MLSRVDCPEILRAWKNDDAPFCSLMPIMILSCQDGGVWRGDKLESIDGQRCEGCMSCRCARKVLSCNKGGENECHVKMHVHFY
jgi:hypothetical protein